MPKPKVMTEEQRRTVVIRLAMYDSVNQIVADLAEEGVTISKQAVSAYNPETNTSRTVGRRWTELFHATRANFLKELAAEPIAHRAYRLRRLEETRRAAMAAGDFKEANKSLEQAAKEVGNVFTNVQVHKGQSMAPGGGSVEIEAMTDEERANMLADRIKDAMERVRAQRTGATLQ